jgi:alpha-beta hydrolase superfamily lysophospholipase
MHRHIRGPLFLLLALLVVACAPVVQDIGPRLSRPAIEEDRFTTADGAELPLRVWPAETPQAVVVAVHGFNDYSNAFALPARWWAARGVTTYAYDQRGFGATAQAGIWAGSAVLTADLADLAGRVQARHPDLPLFLLGESMGAAVVLAAATQPEMPPVDGVILVAPGVWGWNTMPLPYRAALWLTAHLMPGKTLTGRSLDITPTDNLAILRAMWRDPLVIKKTRTDAVYGLVTLMQEGLESAAALDVPTLVLYGERDEIIPPEPVAEVIARITPPPQVIRYPEGYHMLLRDLQGATVWADVLAWIADAPVEPLLTAETAAPATDTSPAM